MASTVHTYDPTLVRVHFGPVILTGFAPGEMIRIARTSQSFTMTSGAYGDVVRTRKRDRSATATIRLLAASPSNDLLSAILDADEEAGTGIKSFALLDKNGTTVVNGPAAWVQKVPEIVRGDEADEVEWMIDIAILTALVGGQTIVGG